MNGSTFLQWRRLVPSPETEKAAVGGWPQNRQQRISFEVLTSVTKRLSELVAAGLPLAYAVKMASEQTSQHVAREIWRDLHLRILAGFSLSRALQLYPRAFSPMYRGMVRTGEMTGSLPELLSHLARWMEDELALRKRFVTTMIYPLCVLVTGIFTVAVLVGFVLPRLTGLLEDTTGELPGLTAFVLTVGQGVAAWGWLAVLILPGLMVVGGVLLRRPRVRDDVQRFLISAPVVGTVLRYYLGVRVCRMMAIMLSREVNLPEIFRTVTATYPSAEWIRMWRRVERDFLNGKSLSTALSTLPIFSREMVAVVATGETSGFLAEAFETVAVHNERELTERLQRIAGLIGPLILVVIVGLMGVVLGAVLIPVLQVDLFLGFLKW